MSYLVRNAERAKGHHATTPQWEKDRDTERGPCLATDYSTEYLVTIRALLAFSKVNNRNVEFATEYGEPGYTTPTPPRCILIANWNEIPDKLQSRLEKQGYALEWCDEWYVDGSRTPVKAWRTQPDHMGWESRVRLIDGDILTPDDDAERWIDSATNDARPLPSWFDKTELTRRGFGKLNQADKEVGLHPGQDETPDKFVPALRKEGFDVILQAADRGQFDASYSIWTRREAERGILFNAISDTDVGERFARNMKGNPCVEGVSNDEYNILESGPEHPDYADTWAEVLNKAILTKENGRKFTLYQDEHVFYLEQGAQHCDWDDNDYITK